MQYHIALWLQEALERACPEEHSFATQDFLVRIEQTLSPSYLPLRGHWSSSLPLQQVENGPLSAKEWAVFLVEHTSPHPWLAEVGVSASGHINLFLTAQAFGQYWQSLWTQGLCQLVSHDAFIPNLAKEDPVAYARQRVACFLRDFASQQPHVFTRLTTLSAYESHWFALQEEADWRLSATLMATYSGLKSGNLSQFDLKIGRLASALHNYYNALRMLGEQPALQGLRLNLLILCFAMLTATKQFL